MYIHQESHGDRKKKKKNETNRFTQDTEHFYLPTHRSISIHAILRKPELATSSSPTTSRRPASKRACDRADRKRCKIRSRVRLTNALRAWKTKKRQRTEEEKTPQQKRKLYDSEQEKRGSREEEEKVFVRGHTTRREPGEDPTERSRNLLDSLMKKLANRQGKKKKKRRRERKNFLPFSLPSSSARVFSR